jgi:RNA polymerase sigma-70 factor (ECF subfamily)
MINATQGSQCAQSIDRAAFKVAACDERTRSPASRAQTNASDEALIAAIGKGDRHTMALLYQRHRVGVYRFALRIVGEATLADDIVSEVFLEVWRRGDRFKARASVSTWLLAIARNMSLSLVKRRGADPINCESIELEDPAPNPEIVVCKGDRAEVIRRCLSELSPTQREVIDLVYYHEKSVAEVAEIIGAPANTVKTRMFHARRRLALSLAAAGYDGFSS